MKQRAVVVCPGRGSYGRKELGSYPRQHPVIQELDAFRSSLQRPTISELDQAASFLPRTHLAGEHASLLTFAGACIDFQAINLESIDIVAVTGNSMGWYIALYCAGALSLSDAARLIETMGAFQKDNVIGAQFLYPILDESWQHDPVLARHIDRILEEDGVELSIRLGGTIVIGVADHKVDWLKANLPSIQRGARKFPLQLPLHSAFHTSLMTDSSEKGQIELADLQISSPTIPLICGRGLVHKRWADPEELWDYTLGHQVIKAYDFSACIQVAIGEYAPDIVILLGPGSSLGSPIGQAMVERRWRGIDSFEEFKQKQSSDSPVLVAMGRSEQRKLVTKSK